MSAELYQIETPGGGVYDLRDSRVDSLNNWSYVRSTNAATTPKDVEWKDGGTTITGTLVASSTTMYKIYLVPSTNGTNDVFDEYITVDMGSSTYQWEQMGDTSANFDDLGALAYKDSASGSVAVPETFTSTTTTTTATTESKSVSVSGTTTGSVTETKGKVTVSKASSGTATYTPQGTNSSSTVSGSCTVTPSGSVSAPTISVKTAGSTTSITGISSVGSMPTFTVSGTKLVIGAGTAPTAATAVTVKTGDAAYEATAPSFTGTSSTGTISGTAEAQTFTGTGARLETDSQVLTGASFSGASMTSTGSVDVPKTYTSSTTTTTATTESKTVTVS